MNFEKYISFTSTYKITKQKRELLPKHEQESAPKFPNIMVCNYQAHSRLLLKQNYPMMTMRRTLDLYKVGNPINRLNSGIKNRNNFFAWAIFIIQNVGTNSVVYTDSGGIKILVQRAGNSIFEKFLKMRGWRLYAWVFDSQNHSECSTFYADQFHI